MCVNGLEAEFQFHLARLGHMADRQRDAFLALQLLAQRSCVTALFRVHDVVGNQVDVLFGDRMQIPVVDVVFEDQQTAAFDQQFEGFAFGRR